MLFYHLGIYDESADNVDVKLQNRVCRKEALGYAYSLVCRVVKRSLKPLRAGRNRRVYDICHNVARKRRDSLASHGIALIRHCR